MWLNNFFKRKSKTRSLDKKINMGFWSKLPKPFFVMAPLADVTDCAFRRIIAKHSRHGEVGGGPDVFWTEFVSADGLSSPAGREALIIDLKYSSSEHPILAQLFGSNTVNMESATRLCAELGFDGIDINMGCPDRSIEKSKSGAYDIKDPSLAWSIVEAARRGAGSLPVSVKTRLGYNKVDWGWVREVLSWNLPAVTFHLRTRKEMSLVPAHWELMAEIIRLRDEISPSTLVIGNGDATDLLDAQNKLQVSGADGVMFGRAIFGNPWLFDSTKGAISIEEKMIVMLEHTKMFVDLLGNRKNFSLMKKHYKAYVNGFDGAKELRVRLMEAEDYETIENITTGFLHSFKGK